MEALVGMLYEAAVRVALASLERNLLPDAVVRRLTRLLLASRLRLGYLPSADLQLARLLDFKRSLEDMPIAVETDKANSQHYELPTSFFKLVLGKNLKYSCCYFQDKSSMLEDAENAMLELCCEHAQVKDGQSILDLGCGWGSLSIYIAKKYPNCCITGICNSATQKAHIEEQCRDLQLLNVKIIVVDIGKFEMEASFDRVISIEMFEHMKNYKELLKKISKWMKQDSLLFVHHFCHRTFPYHFEDKYEDDWITRYFFSGGTMPSANLLLYFQVKEVIHGQFYQRVPEAQHAYIQHLANDDVTVVNHWLVNGIHYARTSEEWLRRMDRNLASIRPIFETTYGKGSATKWIAYWRTFFIAVAELFGYSNGEEWMIAMHLFKKK